MEKIEKKKIEVVIADDHVYVRKGLIQIIAETPDIAVAGEAGDGNELLDQIRKLDPDAVVMDIAMPGKSGWDVIVQLKSERPKLPVIILSVSPEEDYGTQFFKAGASGYLNKTSAPEQLVEAIRTVVKGGLFVSPVLAEKMAFDLMKNTKKLPHEILSPREFQILCMIASGNTVREIAEQLSVSIPTISTHRARILRKMKMDSNAKLVNYAFKYKLLSYCLPLFYSWASF
ncbi:MAG: response regulator transcription factor [Nitrospinae bacterium]|nr:response regulator transcription factor [Nitrospinota bacterium]